MAKFEVNCTIIYNGNIIIDAENEDDAISKVQELIDTDENANLQDTISVGGVNFGLGEITADYSYEF